MLSNCIGDHELFTKCCQLSGVNDLKDPKFNAINEVRGSLAMCEMLRDADENGSVNGILLVFDCTGTSMKHMTHGTMEQNKKTSKIYQVQFLLTGL